MNALTKEELRSLTVERLNGMSEEQLSDVAHQVINELEEFEIELLPKEVKKMLQIKRESLWRSKETWITLIISAVVMTLMQIILGE